MSDCVPDGYAMVLAVSGKRRHEREARLSDEEALLALRAARVLIDHRYAHVGPPAELAWTWRHDLSFYDAVYVALADLSLITGDIRLSRTPDLSCTIELGLPRTEHVAQTVLVRAAARCSSFGAL